MTGTWRDDRNKMRVELLKAELIDKVNFQMTCAEFQDFVILPDKRPLLKRSLEATKYNFKSQTNFECSVV